MRGTCVAKSGGARAGHCAKERDHVTTTRRIALGFLLLAGCFPNSDPFKNATPSAKMTQINVPGAAAGASAIAHGGKPQTLGQTAGMYELTRGIAIVVNGGVAIILGTLEAIVDNPSTTHTATTAEWGPYTPALSPVTWKLDVQQVGAQDYTYALRGKPKAADDSQYQTVLAGSSHVVSEVVGSGDFTLDFDIAHALDPTSLARGQITVHYDNTGDPRVVDVSFKAFDDGKGGTPPDGAMYHYAEHADTSGNLAFAAYDDFDHDGTKEMVTLTSRWLASGQGRSDGTATGGSLLVTANVEECWDASFLETYYSDSVHGSQGDASSCIAL
jgi:hypothetical protein